jgi:hypothetical protein
VPTSHFPTHHRSPRQHRRAERVKDAGRKQRNDHPGIERPRRYLTVRLRTMREDMAWRPDQE